MKGNIMGKHNWSDTGSTVASTDAASTSATPAAGGDATSSGNPTTTVQQPATSPALALPKLSKLQWLGIFAGAGFGLYKGAGILGTLGYAAAGFGMGWLAGEGLKMHAMGS